ncbi:hypothetical protein [Streptomyces justiciae]|uniref:Secreted protein n=1 Tax=Streptomyces justiciae TaxID=2780140 RepID=A0ABU3LYS4_9ACTN|nr:hypothetical protein [Streptomyces justiciae]MDT7843682.1 hypothetical protein [Streptomyces justiciae]
MFSRPLKAAVAVAIAGAFSLTAAPAQAAPADDADVWIALVPTYAATGKYAYEPFAPGGGYARTNTCVPNMGFHYVNAQLRDDPAVDPAKPEVLLYEGGSNASTRKLVGVEWIVPISATAAAPTLFGKTFFKDTALGVYSLHAWIYKSNPNGLFEAYNPRVTCPA